MNRYALTVEQVYTMAKADRHCPQTDELRLPNTAQRHAAALIEYARATMLPENIEGRAALALAWGLVTGMPSEGVDGSTAPAE